MAEYAELSFRRGADRTRPGNAEVVPRPEHLRDSLDLRERGRCGEPPNQKHQRGTEGQEAVWRAYDLQGRYSSTWIRRVSVSTTKIRLAATAAREPVASALAHRVPA